MNTPVSNIPAHNISANNISANNIPANSPRVSNTTLGRILQTDNRLATTLLRIGIGLTLMPHGAQKLFGLFGGYGLTGTGQWMDSIGLHPGILMATLAGSAEFFGGLALLLGLLTRPAAAVTAFTMIIAIFSVHLHNGFFMATNGFEYAWVLLVTTLSLLVSGGGRWSVDAHLSR